MHQAISVPATTANLGPGYDTFGAALTLGLVVISTARGDERVTTRGEGAGEVATGDDNLVWSSLVRFCDEVGVDVPDVSLEVRNPIPLERGLGSSSAAIVAGLAMGRALTGAAVGDRDLVELATAIEGHPDNVAPAILGGITSTASDDRGGLVIRRAQPHARLRPLVFVPAVRQNTKEARGVLPSELSVPDVTAQAARAGHVLASLVGAWPMDVRLSGDRLHEPPRLRVMARSGGLVAALRDAGIHAWLSGAGPSVAASLPRLDTGGHEQARELATQHDFALHDVDWDLGGVARCSADADPLTPSG